MNSKAAQLDTIDALMAGYVSGSLPYPIHILMASHLEIMGDSQKLAATLEGLAGEALNNIEPLNMDPANLADSKNAPQDKLSQIFASHPKDAILLNSQKPPITNQKCAIMPNALQAFTGFTADTIPWRTKMPGFKEYHLENMADCEATLFWIRPGRAIPDHTHEGSEFTLVLDGGFSDTTGHYDRGSISVADSSIDHRPVADDDVPCIGFAVTTGQLKLTGSYGRILGDILGA
ncbi:MAG: ChrR family anti-sigma-E factor [Nitratireductor sp.]